MVRIISSSLAFRSSFVDADVDGPQKTSILRNVIQVEDRVEAEMKVIEGKAKEQVAHGLQDKKLEREAQQLRQEGERSLKAAREAEDEKEKPC